MGADPLSELLRGESILTGEVRKWRRGAKAINSVEQPVGAQHAPETLGTCRFDGDDRSAVVGDHTAPEIRTLFTYDYLLDSNWYMERLLTKQQGDISLWERHIRSLQDFLHRKHYQEEAKRLGIHGRLKKAKKHLSYVTSYTYLEDLRGSLGADRLGS